MKNIKNYILYIILVLVILTSIFAFVGFPQIPAKSANKDYPPSNKGFISIDSGDTSAGSVSIELTPQGTVDNQLIVSLSANTHSVDLSQFDLKQITTLEYEGRSISPVSAPSLNGHHSKGELIFNTGKDIKEFTIKIKNIPKVEERIFTW